MRLLYTLTHCLLFLWQRALTAFAFFLAHNQTPWLKNRLIRFFFCLFTEASLQDYQEKDPFAYASFYDLFSRYPEKSKRPLAHAKQAILAPSDGILSHYGQFNNDTLIQAKGKHYSVQELLGNDPINAHWQTGSHFTIYLQPTDYHRVHSPVDAQLIRTHYIPGMLYSVNPKCLEKIDSLFARNERLVCYFESKHGPFVLIFVGATLVGSIETVWGRITRPKWFPKSIHHDYHKQNLSFKAGDELGHFHFGSTVIVLSKNTDIEFNDALYLGQSIQYGEHLATYTKDSI